VSIWIPSLYLAAPYQRKEEIIGYRRTLQRMGFHITSTWTAEPHDPNIDLDDLSRADPRYLGKQARKDLAEIDLADGIVAFTQKKPARGGYQVELGYALNILCGSRVFNVFVCGPKNTIFCYLPTVECAEDFEELKEMLLGWKRAC
jgi:hypothetical protein